MKNILAFLFISALFGCKIKPDGKDKNGWFVYTDSCTKSHKASGIRAQLVGKSTIMVPYTYSVCDESIITKKYPIKDKLDTTCTQEAK